MATLTGNQGAISIGGIAVLAVRNYSIDMTADTIETTTMSNSQRTYLSGLSSFSGSADVYFDNTDYDTNEATFNPTAVLVGATGVAGKFYLAKDVGGSASADSVFQGSLIVTGYTVNSSFDGMVEASISFQGTGGVTYSTGTNVSYP